MDGSRDALPQSASPDEPPSPTHKRARTAASNPSSIVANVPVATATATSPAPPPIKPEQPRPQWLGQITLARGLRVQDQMVALAMAPFSPRCGANSPARIMGWNLTRQFWRDWAIGAGCKRVFLVDCNVQPGDCKVTLRIGVSLALMGVIDVCVTERGQNRSGVWFGENNCQFDDVVNAKAVEFMPRTKSWNAQRNKHEFFAKSHKWLLQGTSDGPLLIKSMAPATTKAEARTVSVTVPLPVEAAGLSAVNSSQAVILARVDIFGPRMQLLVVDVATTYATKILQVLSTTDCIFPDFHIFRSIQTRVHVMEDQSGQNVFIVETLYSSLPDGDRDQGPWAVVFSMKPNYAGGRARMHYRLRSPSSIVSHVCGPLFSVLSTVLITDGFLGKLPRICWDPEGDSGDT